MFRGGSSGKIFFSLLVPGYQMVPSLPVRFFWYLLWRCSCFTVWALYMGDIELHWLSQHIQNSFKANLELLEEGLGLERGGASRSRECPSLKTKSLGYYPSKSDHNSATSWEIDDEYLCWEKQGFLSNHSMRKERLPIWSFIPHTRITLIAFLFALNASDPTMELRNEQLFPNLKLVPTLGKLYRADKGMQVSKYAQRFQYVYSLSNNKDIRDRSINGGIFFDG